METATNTLALLASIGAVALSFAAHRRRNVIERCFNQLKHNKAPMTLACLRPWLP